jgi:hypothetical protein
MNVGVDRKRLSTILNIPIQAFLPTSWKLKDSGRSQMEKMTLLMLSLQGMMIASMCLKILSDAINVPQVCKIVFCHQCLHKTSCFQDLDQLLAST